jgi:8-oxo-dGTP pyrophosphatase MutT (NUDIX family)
VRRGASESCRCWTILARSAGVADRQFRHAVGGWIWEIPAGRLDAGEKEHPERAAAPG